MYKNVHLDTLAQIWYRMCMAQHTIVERPARQPNSYDGANPRGISVALRTSRRPPLKEPRTYNGSTQTAKLQLVEVFRLCGGIDGMVKWAKRNPSEFYPRYISAMVPKAAEGAGKGDIQVFVYGERVVRGGAVMVRDATEMVRDPSDAELLASHEGDDPRTDLACSKSRAK